MIPQITEINFPEYATLSTATATLVDMGDKTITAQVKIDGSIVPDFSYDWEVEFQGETYIHPLRKPQASKGNESICSTIDLTFYHKGIYDLKRYFFVSIAEVGAGTIMADNYIVPLALNLGSFVDYLNKVLEYYYGSTYKVYLNPDWEYDETDIKSIDINYTKIWDVLIQMYEVFGVRWSISQEDENAFFIEIGYPSKDVSHVFEYGFEGGLLKFERQVQDAEICNRMFGRGGSQNLPYRYFKKVDPYNTSWKADPDWIPELELINLAELRGKSFRDYVRGWKAKHYGGQLYLPATDAYTKGFTDEEFDPIDYVEDASSIAKYGLIQGGLDNNEEIFPTIQNRDLGNGLGRADEIVDAELILVDEPTTNTESVTNIIVVDDSDARRFGNASNYTSITLSARSADIYVSNDGSIVKDIDISIAQYVKVTRYSQQYDSIEGWVDIGKRVETNEVNTLQIDTLDVSVIDANTKSEIKDIANIPQGTTIYISALATASGLLTSYIEETSLSPDGYQYRNVQEVEVTSRIVTSFQTEIDLTPFHGLIIGNYVDGVNRVSASATIGAEGASRVTLKSETFTIDEGGATSVDVPIRITSSDTSGSYSERKTINAVNTSTNEVLDPSNLSEGTYCLQIVVDITNLTKESQTYKVELLPSYIYYPYDSAKWRPTFDIWIKDIWGSTRLDDENDTSYAERVWRPILGELQGNEAKVVFSSGWLSGHSDYEFPIVAFAFDDTKTLKGVPSHWRLTLAKSDAEVDASGKWLPSTQTQASAGDHFYFIGIDMPHQYVLWAEEEVDKWKRENMPSQIKPTYVVQTDKVRLNEMRGDEEQILMDYLRIGKSLRIADCRFIEGDYELLHLQSVTYTWDASTIMLPTIEVVLSENIPSLKNPIKETQYTLSQIRLDVNKVTLSTASGFNRLTRSTISNENKTNQVSAQVSETREIAVGARSDAYKAQNWANRALNGVSSLDFIKGVFSDDEILDEKAAVLSRLVAVKDINNEVTAGIYGGGVDGLDSVGYKDSSHGTLMMFAGASGASNASNSKFRVYEDGSIFANSGVFGGVIKKGTTIVTPENILDFAIPVAGAFGNLVIDIARMGSYIVFDGFQNTAWSENYTSLNLPAYYGGDVPSISIGYSFNDLIGLIGVDLIFRATSDINSDLCFSVPRITVDGEISPVCVTIKEGDIIIATCTARRDSNENLNIGWELNII